jgi:hypothetical protein
VHTLGRVVLLCTLNRLSGIKMSGPNDACSATLRSDVLMSEVGLRGDSSEPRSLDVLVYRDPRASTSETSRAATSEACEGQKQTVHTQDSAFVCLLMC